MAPGSPELRLNVSLDLDNFKRVALPGLANAASNFALPIGVQFNRDDITKEMVRLGRQLGAKKYRVDFEITNLKTALEQVDQLSAKFKELRQQSIAATGGGTIAQSRFKSPKISTSEIAAIYRAAGEAGMLSLNESITANKGEMAKELAKVAKDSITGLVNGMVEGKAGVGNAFAELGAEGLKRIKAELGIASPSKRMQQIGKWAGEGYEIGFIGALERANAKAAATIGKSLRAMDREVDVRQRAARIYAPGERNRKGQVPFVSLQERLGTSLGRREQLETAAQIPQLRGAAGTFAEGSAQRLNKLLQSAQLLAAGIKPDTKEWARAQSEIAVINIELAKSGQLAQRIQMQANLAAFAPKSLAYLESQLTLLKLRARDIAPDTDKWRQLNREIQHTERNIEKVTRKPLTGKERVGAAGGAFLYGGGMGGGAGSALGGIGGGLIGGVPGAFAGAAAGQFVDNMIGAGAGLAKTYAELQKMQRGLAMASIDAKDFAQAQDIVGSMSQRLLVPLVDLTRYYAQLRVNTKQYNISAKETGEILEGTISAIRATGGSLEDVDGAMRAVVQIFSKGGVQAEELRGQLGERFPGAVVKFAQANKLTFEELQSRLEAGTVGIAEFVAFSKSNFEDYAEFTKKLATGPEYAGDRLKIALEKLQRTIGPTLAYIGARFQDVFTTIINNWDKAARLLAKIFNMRGSEQLKEDIAEAKKEIVELQKWEDAGTKTGIAQKKKDLLDMQKQLTKVEKDASMVYGGKGANMPTTRTGNDKAKQGLEGFEKLRDDLAKTYNDAEIARIKEQYELRKRLQQDQFDMQEYGANRLQKQNLALIRGLIGAETARFETVQNAQLEVRKQSGKVAGGAGGGGGMVGLAQYITGDPSQKGYQADHGTIKDYHDHLAFTTRKAAEDAYKKLVAEGIKVTEFKGYGKGVTGPHSGPGSLHHQGLAFDVPGYQWGGTGAIGAKEYAGSARVRQVLGMEGQVGAGSRRQVKGGEQRDVMAKANTAIAQGAAQQAALDANIIKSASVMKEFARYAAEAYNIPDLKLSNELLKLRNDLTEQGMAPEVIDYQVRLYELDAQRKDLLADFPKKINGITLSEDARKAGMAALAAYLDKAKIAEKEKNDETLRGLRIAKLATLNDQLAMAGALTPDEERRLRIQQENPNQTAEFQNQLFSLEKQVEAAQKLKEQLTGIASTIGTSFGDAFKGIITGSMTAQEALAGFFQNLSNYFADMVSKMIADWLRVEAINGLKSLFGIAGGSGFSFTGDSGFGAAAFGSGFQVPGFAFANGGIAAGGFQAFATGGIVTGPTLGLVGEGRYNEAVIPLPDGKSVPVDLGGMSGGMASAPITVNVSVDAKGSEVQGDSAQGAALGRVIAASVQSELIKQKRPGGLLAK